MKCDKNMSLEECELAILRYVVDTAGQVQGTKFINDPKIIQIIKIVEQFLRNKRRIWYGGSAINNILPKKDQFYDKKVELPDYDFFSPDALKDAKNLADIYVSKGFEEVEAKAGIHHGTYKVYVNFIPVADITQLTPEIYKTLIKKSIKVGGIFYAPPDYLRMGMYLELSRPMGDTSRWEKVLKRLTLLNKNYPLKGLNCDKIQIQRLFGSVKHTNSDKLFNIIRDCLIKEKCVFFGALANKLYLKTLPKFKNKTIPRIPDFDVLSSDPRKTANIIKKKLKQIGLNSVYTVMKKGIGEIIAPHYEVKIGSETVAFIYQPLACHSYNVIKIGKRNIRIATIDTMLSFYLAFIHVNRPYYDPNRILCMSEFLFKVQEKNRLEQKGLLKRFSVNCIGEQATMASIRAEKSKKYFELKDKRGTSEYEEYFLHYTPSEKKGKKTRSKKKTTRKKTKRKRRRKKPTRRRKRRKTRRGRRRTRRGRKNTRRKKRRKRRRKRGMINRFFKNLGF